MGINRLLWKFRVLLKAGVPDQRIGAGETLDLGKKTKSIRIAPHKSNRVRAKTQDGRRLRRYQRRWIVERFFAWLQWQRRLLVRWEYYPANFLGFVQLACIAMLLKQF